MQLDRTQGQTDTHRITLPSPAHHRAHWTKWHKAEEMSRTIRLVRCRNVNDYSRDSEQIFRPMFQLWPHNPRWVLLEDYSLFLLRKQTQRDTQLSQLRPKAPTKPSLLLNHCDVIDRLQSLWSQSNSCLPSNVKVIERYYAQIVWFQKCLRPLFSESRC